MVKNIFRGEIYSYNSFEGNRLNYCIVMQNNVGNMKSSTTIVLDLQDRLTLNKRLIRASIVDKKPGRRPKVLYVSKTINTIDRSRLIERAGRVPRSVLTKITISLKELLSNLDEE